MSRDEGSTRPPPSPLDPVQVAAATLACLPDMTTGRLRDLVARWHGPIGALNAVQQGLAAGRAVRERLGGADAGPCGAGASLAGARRPIADPGAARRTAHARVREGARRLPDRRRPSRHARGAARRRRRLEHGRDVFERPRVAIVGTRAATPHGLADAREIGAVLADAGITVVSGLAIGIDAAAHEGALDAGGPVVGVVGTGLDVVYPRRHHALFDRVRRGGLLVSELGYGVQPRRESFPIRNRIIAALADVVVVVEATMKGGARITAERAVEYDRPVLAMPGARRNPAAAGTNALIADGAHPLLEPSDVLLALGLTPGARGARRPTPAGGQRGRSVARVRWRSGVDRPARQSHRARPDQVAVAVRDLERGGWLERSRGLCWPK